MNRCIATRKDNYWIKGVQPGEDPNQQLCSAPHFPSQAGEHSAKKGLGPWLSVNTFLPNQERLAQALGGTNTSICGAHQYVQMLFVKWVCNMQLPHNPDAQSSNNVSKH